MCIRDRSRHLAVSLLCSLLFSVYLFYVAAMFVRDRRWPQPGWPVRGPWTVPVLTCNISWFSVNVILADKLFSCFTKAPTLFMTATPPPAWSTSISSLPTSPTVLSLSDVINISSTRVTRCSSWFRSINRRFTSANSFILRSIASSWTRRRSTASTRTLSKCTAFKITTH